MKILGREIIFGKKDKENVPTSKATYDFVPKAHTPKENTLEAKKEATTVNKPTAERPPPYPAFQNVIKRRLFTSSLHSKTKAETFHDLLKNAMFVYQYRSQNKKVNITFDRIEVRDNVVIIYEEDESPGFKLMTVQSLQPMISPIRNKSLNEVNLSAKEETYNSVDDMDLDNGWHHQNTPVETLANFLNDEGAEHERIHNASANNYQ